MDMKANVGEVESLKGGFERIYREIDEKAEMKDLDSHIIFTKNAFEEVNKELLLRCYLKDLCQLLDEKASTDDVNSTLEKVQKEVQGRISKREFREASDKQNLLNEILCGENCVGRWIWKSGDLKNLSVPWEIKSINSAPDNFLWEEGKTSIVCAAPGLYELKFGFYSKKAPSITVHVNGEPILTASNDKES